MIHGINDNKEWNGFLLNQPSQAGIFLQSWEWGEFQKAVGRPVFRYCGEDGNAQVVELPLPLGKKYWYIPRSTVISGLVEEAKKRGILFLRIEPTQALKPKTHNPKPTRPINPSQTLLIDLTKSEDELLAAMHEKTRYNIRLALRKGVTTTIDALHPKMADRPFLGGTLEFEEFWELLQETAKRDGFRTHPAEYYQQMLEILGNPQSPIPNSKQISNIQYPISNSMSVRFHATYHDGAMLAGAIVAYFGDTATYLHGASSYEHRALMGPYALHWEIMREAKKAGYKFYDFWGINTSYKLQATSYASWSGMTRFKLGFGGTVVDYPGTFDLPLNKFWCTLYRFGRKIL